MARGISEPVALSQGRYGVLEALPRILTALRDIIAASGDITAETLQAAAKDIAASHTEGKMGKVGMPLRAALTGVTVSPSIFHAAAILGRDETLARLDYAIGQID